MNSITTPLICSECGQGNYAEGSFRPGYFDCTRCEHAVTTSDLVLDEGETAGVDYFGRLVVNTPAR